MAPPNASIHLADGRLTVSGELGWPIAAEFDEACQKLAQYEDPELIIDLSEVYSTIENVEYDAKLCRKYGDDFRQAHDPIAHDHLEKHWKEYGNKHKVRETNLREKINGLLDKDFFKKNEESK